MTPSFSGPPPWLFGLTNIAFGVAGGYTSVAMPFVLRAAGVPLSTIGGLSAAVLLPLGWQFLWAPMLDLGFPRRIWLLLSASVCALLLGASLLLSLPSDFGLFAVCCVLGQAASGLVSACNGALVATLLPAEVHGRASGWLNAANLGGNAIGGGLVIGALHGHSNGVAALLLALLVFLPALAVLRLREPPRVAQAVSAALRAMAGEVGAVLKTRRGWTGAVFCLAPVSTPALLDLFSAVGEDYGAAAGTVELSMGYGSGLATAVGALLGGRMLDRFDKRRAYLASGVAIALVDLGMALAPLTPTSYVLGTLAYSLVAGVCFAAFTAMVLEIVGNADAGAATRYALFDAGGNLATAYLAWFDGQGYALAQRHGASGAQGLLLTDAGMNLFGVAALLLLVTLLARRRRS